MIWKAALTARRDVDLLGPFLQMHLGGGPVSALDVDGGKGGKISDEMAFAELINLLFNWNNFKRAEILGSLELLHVQRSETGIVKIA